MKNESMEQLNALKSCPFGPGAIWNEQHMMSMLKILYRYLLYGHFVRFKMAPSPNGSE